MSNSLSTRAMIVSLSLTQWTARKHDKKITADVAAQHNATENAGRYNKNLLPFDAPTYKAIGQCANAARTAHYEQTLPWSDNEGRILPSTNFMEYNRTMRKLHNDFDNAVAAFLPDYPLLQQNAQRLLNGMYKQEDYPTQSELAAKFTFATRVIPLPDVADFRVINLHDDIVDEIKTAYAQELDASTSKANADLYQRLYKAVAHITERLGDTEAIFRDSLIVNVRELCDLVPRLNLTDDPALEAMRDRIEKSLAGFEPEDLRENKALRASVAKIAARIQGDMGAIMGVQP